MAQRTTIGAVKKALRDVSLGGDYDGATDLQQYIDEATLVVDRVATCAAARDKTLTSAELEMIERLLAAHNYAMADQTYASKSTGGASGNYHGQTGMYLEGTKYGQRALQVDYSGCLAAIASGAKRKVASVAWLGKAPSEQVDYVDRD